jgi:hypothetical protein
MVHYLEIFVAIAVFVVLGRFLLAPDRADPWNKGASATQTFLVVIGAVVAGFWFFFERPHAPKIDISETATALRIDGKHALIVAEVKLKNYGETSIDLRRTPYEVWLQQVTPLTPLVASEVGRSQPNGHLQIFGGDNWGAFASRNGTLTDFLEAGEADNLYYRVATACVPNLVMYLTFNVRKPTTIFDYINHTQHLSWRRQVLVDTKEACAVATDNKGKTQEN